MFQVISSVYDLENVNFREKVPERCLHLAPPSYSKVSSIRFQTLDFHYNMGCYAQERSFLA